jgi:hypothetical protein
VAVSQWSITEGTHQNRVSGRALLGLLLLGKTGRTSESSDIKIEFITANLCQQENIGETGHLYARTQQQRPRYRK